MHPFYLPILNFENRVSIIRSIRFFFVRMTMEIKDNKTADLFIGIDVYSVNVKKTFNSTGVARASYSILKYKLLDSIYYDA